MKTAMPATLTARTARTGLVARAAVVVNGGLAVAFVALWLHLAARGSFWRSDFTAFYLGGRMVLAGDGARLYDLDAQGDWQARLWPERGGGEALLAFVYPPQDAVLFAPLALLPRGVAFYVWILLNVGLLAVLVIQVRRLTEDWSAPARAAAVATLLAFPPLFISFQLGQLYLLGLVCLLGFYQALRQDRAWAAAGWLVLGTVKPQLALIPAVTLLAGRRWRALAAATGLFAAWALVTTAVLGPSCWSGFVAMVSHCSRQFGTYGIDPLAMFNLKGLFTALLGPEQAGLINALTATATAASVLVAMGFWWGPWPGDTPAFARRAALTLLLGLVANPHLNPGDALAYAAPALLLAGALAPGSARRTLALAAAAAPLLFMLDVYSPGRWAGRIHPFFLLILTWAAWLAWDTLSRRRVAGNAEQLQATASAGAGN
jgi:hypothetical protein